ncbi:16S rRNA (guanine(966)-N(2))-methyltransferase RsmD [Halalkalibacillus halophilus]|uniref:16S rRNA (guanine(966)-N(2))-methyltransferase RsmD n=1 Tax=Halalkalibacillus halophilus TaxID=392827 RepID=UPI00040AA57D|nr:16S rRNA (guanine(966)-N(2))-methyltransferase RsmD [Halalkalibacillus halophilus]
MRIVSGKYKGHRLKAVPHNKTRPTADKVKESLFHSIGPFFNEGKGLDLFAGSGNLGLEALSRGLDHVVFVDHDYQSVQTIKANIKALQLELQTEVYKNDAYRALKAAAKREKKFDYVFLDPPYEKISYYNLMETLKSQNLLSEGATIICEHAQGDELPKSTETFKIIKQINHSNVIANTIYRYNSRR